MSGHFNGQIFKHMGHLGSTYMICLCIKYHLLGPALSCKLCLVGFPQETLSTGNWTWIYPQNTPCPKAPNVYGLYTYIRWKMATRNPREMVQGKYSHPMGHLRNPCTTRNTKGSLDSWSQRCLKLTNPWFLALHPTEKKALILQGGWL